MLVDVFDAYAPFLFITCAHAQGVKQSVLSVCRLLSLNTKIARSRVLGICACCKHNESVDIGEKLVSVCFKVLKWLTSATNRAFCVLHACGLPTTPTLLACGDATAHA